MKILVCLEQRNGKVKSSGLEVLTAACKLAGGSQAVTAVIVGAQLPEAEMSSFIKGYGAQKLIFATGDDLSLYNPLSYAAAIESVIKKVEPQLVLASATAMGRDLFPRLAARFKCGMLTDLIKIQVSDQKFTGTKPMYAGKCLVELQSRSAMSFATLRPNVFAAEVLDQSAVACETLAMGNLSNGKIKTIEIRKGKSDKPDLTEAQIIVSGGQSLGSAENFKILQDLAEVLGATIGASRAAVNAGYAAHDMQVGQTGKTVTPNLYIACGISGAIQHLAGMRTSKVIVAINSDPEAPIFSIANYGLVGDLFKIVPLLTQKFRELLK